METKIKLPELPKDDAIPVSQRTKVLEYYYQGKILTDEEAKEILQKWIDYICKLVPQTRIKYKSWIEKIDESSKSFAESSKNTVLKYYALKGEEVPKALLSDMDDRIAKASDNNSILWIHIFEAIWELGGEDGKTISSVDMWFLDGKENCSVFWYTEDGYSFNSVSVDSWEKGIKLYIQHGEEWLKENAPKMEIPSLATVAGEYGGC